MIKKLLAIFLALLFCFCAVGCADTDPDAPEGMKSATISGEPFVLYVPDGWTDNTSSGISGAYYPSVDGLSVSARYTAANGISVEQYLTDCLAALGNEYANKEFSLIEDKAVTTLGTGKTPLRITYTFKRGDIILRCSQITAEHNGDLISLYIYCPDGEEYEKRKDELESIRSSFVTKDKAPAIAPVITKDTPEGMKLASNKDIEYRLFVPTEWICDPESGASEAYYPESGRPNITVTSFVPDASIHDVNDYFKSCEERYKAELPEYSFVSGPEEREVSGRKAYIYIYTVKAGDADIRIMQTIFSYDSSIYTVTYTAAAESFDTHRPDVDKILDSFKFR